MEGKADSPVVKRVLFTGGKHSIKGPSTIRAIRQNWYGLGCEFTNNGHELPINWQNVPSCDLNHTKFPFEVDGASLGWIRELSGPIHFEVPSGKQLAITMLL
jgi:hypothetical protein